MELSINYSSIAHPVVKETNKGSFIYRWVMRLLEDYKTKHIKRLEDLLDSTILSTEGSYERLKAFTPERAQITLDNIKEIISKLEVNYDKVIKYEFIEKNDPIDKKFRYLLKCLYKAESIAHKIVHRDSIKINTDNSLKEGVIKMNSAYHKAQ